MAATVDRLSAHHRVTVLRDFVDARGIAVLAGASGVIKLIEVDFPKNEFSIDWERDGKRERLTFSLAAKEGPRNGGMKEYFELGEYVAPPRPKREPTPETLTGLSDLMKRSRRRTPTVVEAIRIVINELNGVDNRPEQHR